MISARTIIKQYAGVRIRNLWSTSRAIAGKKMVFTPYGMVESGKSPDIDLLAKTGRCTALFLSKTETLNHYSTYDFTGVSPRSARKILRSAIRASDTAAIFRFRNGDVVSDSNAFSHNSPPLDVSPWENHVLKFCAKSTSGQFWNTSLFACMHYFLFDFVAGVKDELPFLFCALGYTAIMGVAHDYIIQERKITDKVRIAAVIAVMSNRLQELNEIQLGNSNLAKACERLGRDANDMLFNRINDDKGFHFWLGRLTEKVYLLADKTVAEAKEVGERIGIRKSEIARVEIHTGMLISQTNYRLSWNQDPAI